jgi:peptidoglycan-associated lipoprotein
MRTQIIKVSAVLLALTLLIFAAGCKKKPPPPPPPPPVVNTPPPAPPAAVINSFAIEPSTIENGGAATLRWSISNATDMAIDQGVGAVQSEGTRQVSPTATTTYTLSVHGPGGSDSKTATVSVTSPPPPPPPPPPTAQVDSPETIINRDVKDIYFDYDKNDIRGEAQTILQSDADVLKKVFTSNPGISVLIEGNCDERGSAEYNLALGDRRAQSAKDYLVTLGVGADKLKTISYGKEKPACTDATEDCYQRNRHDHFAPAQH